MKPKCFTIMKKPLILFGLITIFVIPVIGDSINIGSRLELFVDDTLIDTFEDAELRMHHPVARETVLRFDRPWEGRYCGYVTVFKDEDRYRMYYRGLPMSGADGSRNEVTCYAESEDGIHWEKPDLDQYEVNGTHQNNVILKDAPPFSHNFCPFLDHNPATPEDKRYKALAGTGKTGLHAFVSADGIHWIPLQNEAVITKGAFDSQNVAFWSEAEKCYVCYFRTWTQGVRSISRTTSRDFIHWTPPIEMDFGDTPREHLYTNQTQPYFRAPHIYIATPARFMPGRRVLTSEEFKSLGGESAYSGDCSDTVLMSSRGGNRYVRTFMEAFVRPGLGAANWSSRTNYTACGVVSTGKGEMSLYIQRRYGQPEQCLQRLTLRTDGFASLHASYQGGEAITKPLRFDGNEFVINMSTSAAGSIWVELQNEKGDPIEGYTMQDCDEIIGDQIERRVRWNGNTNLEALKGKPVRMRFILKDADIYSFRFR